MVEVDARGLSCPEPIMLTAEALKNEKGPIKVLEIGRASCRERV